jgi:chorismate mutase
MNEIATIKQENGRLIEKYKFEQKQVHKLKDDLKKKQKYEQFFEKQRAKKFRNCGC